MAPLLLSRCVTVDLQMDEGSVFDPVFALLDADGALVPLEAATTAHLTARASHYETDEPLIDVAANVDLTGLIMPILTAEETIDLPFPENDEAFYDLTITPGGRPGDTYRQAMGRIIYRRRAATFPEAP